MRTKGTRIATVAYVTFAALFAGASSVVGHDPNSTAPTPTALFSAWVLEPVPWIAVIAAAVLYLVGVHRVNRRNPRTRVPGWRICAWLAGLFTIVAALASSIDVYADDLLSAHMVQHLLLTFVAPPLLALGAPGTLCLRAARPDVRRRVLLPLLHSRMVRLLTYPTVAWTAFAVVMVLTHFTYLYETALENPLAHDLEHALFLVSGILFWWPVVAADPIPHRMRHGSRVVYLLAMVPVGSAVGLTIYFAKSVLYEHYGSLERTWGPSALIDQQLGGLLMWAACDVVLLAAVALVLADWMRADEERTRVLDARRAAGVE